MNYALYGLLAVFLAGPLPAENAEIAVIMHFEQPYSAESLAEMEHELDSILLPGRLHIEYRLLSDAVSQESFPELVMAHFKGSCRTQPEVDPERASVTLGLTHISDGRMLPFSELDCDRVRRFMALSHGEHDEANKDRQLGRGMARVLAHELYHVLTHSRVHAHTGVAKAILTRADLLRRKLHFENEQLSLLGAHFRMQPAASVEVAAKQPDRQGGEPQKRPEGQLVRTSILARHQDISQAHD